MRTPTAHEAAICVRLLEDHSRYLSHRIPENRAHNVTVAEDQVRRMAAIRVTCAWLRARFGIEGVPACQKESARMC